ncbi:MAG: HupE/UreJ family protein [Asticcacaulis sp.]|uniref:HupE/UreJ family protein n=1 Tax=Asticcacaulis sp. TaxID=1872648 RepID=UPI0039E53AC3
MKRLAALVTFVLALIAAAQPAAAHTRSESHTSWALTGPTARVDVTLPELEAQKLTPDHSSPGNAQLMDYFRHHIGVSADKQTCPLNGTPSVLSATSGYRRFEYVFACPSTKDMTLHFTGLFEAVPTHTDFAQIQMESGEFVEQLFTKDVTEIDTGAANGGELRDAGFLQFVTMGIMHIFTGVDHMSFLLGLILLSRKLKDLLFVVTGFTIGHSLTLALAVTGIIRPHAEFIDALVAFTIGLVGIENIVHTQKNAFWPSLAAGGFLLAIGVLKVFGIGLLPPLLLFGAALFTFCYLMVSGTVHEFARVRLVVTLVFGLIHGFGFASDLLKDRLPVAKLAQILFGFNIGVEIGQVCVVLAILGVVALLRKVRLVAPRPITVDVVASFLVCIGTYWFVSRSF